nr:hypothetical protein [Sphingomonas profundi]
MSIARTAELAGCSIAQVKRVTAIHRAKTAPSLAATDIGPDSCSDLQR